MPSMPNIEAYSGYRNYVDSYFVEAQQLGGGKMQARAAADLHPRAFKRIYQHPGVQEYHIRDKVKEDFFNHCEEISNTINEHLLSMPVCREVKKRIEENHDHGINHIRRIEKWWYKEAFAHDIDLRSKKELLYSVPCAYLAMRFHDITEVYSGEKDKHNTTAALFALGYLSKLFTPVNEIWSMPAEDWDKIIWGTVFICLHHSNPKYMPQAEEMLQKGLFDPRKVYQETVAFLDKSGQTYEEYFPPFALIREELADMKNGIFREPPWYKKREIRDIFHEDLGKSVRRNISPFSGEVFRDFVSEEESELEALRLQAFLFSACDKLDSNYPPGLSAARTFLSKPNRAFYVAMGHFDDIGDEVEARRTDGGKEASMCDLNRLLYEITRTEDFENIGGFMTRAISTTLREKSAFLLKAIPDFLRYDFSEYIRVYDELEAREIRNLLRKAGLSASYAESVTDNQNIERRNKRVRRLLTDYGYDSMALDFLLYEIDQERETVWLALERKFRNLGEIDRDEIKHIEKLVHLAVQKQKATLRTIPGPPIVPPDYSYYVLDLEQWRIGDWRED